MKRTLIFILILVIGFSLNASITNQISTGIGYCFDNNVFSNPLPSYVGSNEWLIWRNQNPFIQKHNISFNIEHDIFFSETSRIGLSQTLNVNTPLYAKEIRPIASKDNLDFTNDNWEYVTSEITNTQKTSVFYGIGTIIRAQLGITDIGVAFRFSIGGYDYSEQEIIIGIQAEPFLDIFFSSNIYMNIKATYDAHLFRFYENDENLFHPHYTMLAIAPTIGIGIRF